MKESKIILAALVALVPGLAQAQKGEVRLAVQPSQGLQYILDGAERMSNPGLMLPAGPHRFVFYAPDRSILDTTIQVYSDSVVLFRKVLPPTPEYRAHLAARQRNGYNRFLLKATPIAVTSAATFFALSANRSRIKADESLREAEEQYAVERNPAEIAGLKESVIPARQAELDAAHRRTLIWTGVAVIGAAATVAGFIKAARIEDPLYEDKEKIRFDGMAWAGPRGMVYMASLQIPLR